MVLKPKILRRLFLSILIIVAMALVAIVVVPPMINFNGMRAALTQAIVARTGVDATINGDIRLSLIGGPTLSATDIRVAGGTIAATRFAIPWSGIFNVENAPLSGDIVVYGARLKIDRLIPVTFDHAIRIYHSEIEFYGKEYEIIDAIVHGSTTRAIVRTNQHKYEINTIGDEFVITNRANDLLITGRLYNDGSARGSMRLDAADVNAWFEFSSPRIDTPVKLEMDFNWDGGYGFEFTHIRGDNFAGDITLASDGERQINLRAWDVDFDMGFLTRPTSLFDQTSLNINLTGNLNLMGRTFKSLRAVAHGTNDAVIIDQVVLDDIRITGGQITPDGAQNVFIQMPIDGKPGTCMFSGTPRIWECSQFTWGDIAGRIAVNDDHADIYVHGSIPAPKMDEMISYARRIASGGTINFEFSDMAGHVDMATDPQPSFTFARQKPLKWGGNIATLFPHSFQKQIGDFAWDNGAMTFTPRSRDWTLRVRGRSFEIKGVDIKHFIGNIDTPFLNTMPYTITGVYDRGNIADLRVHVGDMEFSGSMADGTITLVTPLLNIDRITRQEYIDQYAELAFLGNAPIMTPFDLEVRVALRADTLIYNGNSYQNFVYALKPDVQTFSISDNDRGNLLIEIGRDKKNYTISVMADRFVPTGALLPATMPINVTGAAITGTAHLTTSGKIAYDIQHNVAGTMDMTLVGGIMNGLGLDAFYAAASTMTTLNAESMLAMALDGGQTRIKKIHIAGRIDDTNFETTQPMTMSLYHVDGQGTMTIQNNQINADWQLVMRGTSATPMPILLGIRGDKRDYSLSEIMIHFDPDYLRDFSGAHDKF